MPSHCVHIALSLCAYHGCKSLPCNFTRTHPSLQVSDAFAKRLSAAASAAEAAEATRAEAEARSQTLLAEAEEAREKLKELESSNKALKAKVGPLPLRRAEG